VDAQGQLLAQGRDLAELVQRFRADTRQSISANQQTSPAREGITCWDLGELPREWRFRQAGVDILAHPALVDAGETVAIELCDYPSEAYIRHRLGVLRLLRLDGAQQVKYLRKQLLRGNEFNLVLAGTKLERNALVEDLIDAAFIQSAGLGENLPYAQSDFQALAEAGKRGVIARAGASEVILLTVLRLLVEIRQKFAALEAGKWSATRADIEAQLSALLAGSFHRDTPAESLAHYPRYMKALLQRIERLPGQYPKDEKYTASLQVLTQPLAQAVQERPALLLLSAQATTYRWMLEEFRVSLFAQNLGTRQAVSEKRLREQWECVKQWLDENPH
jgi:ATP-dependent helicase HrpA